MTTMYTDYLKSCLSSNIAETGRSLIGPCDGAGGGDREVALRYNSSSPCEPICRKHRKHSKMCTSKGGSHMCLCGRAD